MRFSVTKKKTVRTIACLLFCLFVCAMAFLNRTLVLDPVTGFFQGHGSFAEMKSTLQRNLLGDRLRGKDELLSLNGGYAGLQGRTRYNGVQKMTNGMLTATIEEMADTSRFADNLSRFCRFLEGKNIQYVTNVPSLRSDVVPDFAKRLALKLGLEYVPILGKKQADPLKKMENSSYQCSNAFNSFYVLDGSVIPDRVLLVDDVVDSKWTLTVCGYLIMSQGCEKVFPYALADSSQKED